MKRIVISILTLTLGDFTALNLSAQVAAPTSLSGKVIIATLTAPKAETVMVSLDDATFADSLGHAGDFIWNLTDTSHGVLTLTNEEADADQGDVTTLHLAFKNNYSGSITGQVALAAGGSKPEKGNFTFDVTRPTLSITSPKPNAKWSNDVFTVTGKAGDKVAVANVLASVDGGSWLAATNMNDGWTNWTTTASLVPGPNTIAAYAVDTSGNCSLTNVVKLDYILSAQLTVVISPVGSGTVNPNDNGKMLAISNSYPLTAVPAKGFGFVDWSGGVPLSNNPKLTFTMVTNLTIIANFKDTAKPVVKITSPAMNLKWSGTNINVTGTASDNVGVIGVGVQINNGGWLPANGTTNWMATNLPVVIGENILQAYAVDAAGNASLTNEIKFTGVTAATTGFAPASLAGQAATLKITGVSPMVMTWSDDTWALMGSDTNKHYYDAGDYYAYTPTGPNTAVLTNVNIGMMSSLGTTNVTIINLTFTSATSANVVWDNGVNSAGSGTMTLKPAADLVPASLAGKTVQVNANGALVMTLTLNSDGTFSSTNKNGGAYGTYTFTQYSPTVAILQRNFTDPNDAGGLEFLEMAFTSATAGTAFGGYYDNPAIGNDPDDIGLGTFEIKSVSTLAPASLSGYAATVKVAGKTQTLAMTWGDSTWAQTGTGNDTNADDYCAGTYAYVQTGPNTGVMTNMDIGMMSWLGTTNVITVNVTFTSATSGNCTWQSDNGSGTATMTFSQIKNLVPVSIAGKTLTARGSQIIFASDGNYTDPASANNGEVPDYGTYTFTQYSPTVAILQLNSNVSGDSYYGAVAYSELTFTSSTSINIAQSWYENPSLGSNPDDWGQATGTIK